MRYRVVNNAYAITRPPGHHAERAVQPARVALRLDVAAHQEVRPRPAVAAAEAVSTAHTA
mgnify:CR=1 FL=1